MEKNKLIILLSVALVTSIVLHAWQGYSYKKEVTEIHDIMLEAMKDNLKILEADPPMLRYVKDLDKLDGLELNTERYNEVKDSIGNVYGELREYAFKQAEVLERLMYLKNDRYLWPDL